MEYARKMVLVPEERMNRHIPTDEFLSDLDKEMKKILLSRESNDIKIKLYNQALNKRILTPVLNPPVNEIQPREEETPVKIKREGPVKIKAEPEDFVKERVLRTVPAKMKNVAENIMQLFKENPKVVSWTPNGELVYNGLTVKRSNIVDLVDHMLRNRKSSNVYVPKEFVEALKDINLPSTYIKNKRFHSTQVGKSLSNVKSKDIVKPKRVIRWLPY